jgi:hypothetical protein
LSIVLLAILAVMWVAFLLPLIAPWQRRGPGWAGRSRARTHDAGWRPTPDVLLRGASPGAARSGPAVHARAARTARTGPGRPRAGRAGVAGTAGRSVLRRRRVLLGLTLAAATSIRVRYVLGGDWWIAEAVAGTLLGAYVVALVVQGFRRHHPALPALPAAPPRRALPPPRASRAAAVVSSPAPPLQPTERRGLRWRRRRRADGPIWGAPLLEGQGPPSPE